MELEGGQSQALVGAQRLSRQASPNGRPAREHVEPAPENRRLRDQATLGFYADEASIYVASGSDGASRRLDAFLQLLAAGARILELGCDGGRDSDGRQGPWVGITARKPV